MIVANATGFISTDLLNPQLLIFNYLLFIQNNFFSKFQK